jgi:hypothetical protein
MQTPLPLTDDERRRLAELDAVDDDQKTDQDLLDEMTLHFKAEAWAKYRSTELIRYMLPPADSGQKPERGLFTRVVAATPYTREFVARIRDRKTLVYED